MDMNGKVAIITGAANGIGREIALVFAQSGYAVGAVDLDAKNLETITADDRGRGATFVTSMVDISDSGQVRGFVETISGRFGRIDVLINCAAHIVYQKFLDFDETTWRRMLDVNLTGYFLFGQAVARKMVENGNGGRIVNIASVAADFGHNRASAYGANKAGIIALTKVMSLELGPFGINVMAISPGPIATDQARRILTDEEMKQRANMTALGKYGQPADVAKAALFLASEDAQFITGSVLLVDGGLSWTRK